MTPEDILKRFFGYDTFRPEADCDADFEWTGHLGGHADGSRKVRLLSVPALARQGVALVISPLISLMQDQVRTLQSAGIPGTCVDGEESRRTHTDFTGCPSWKISVFIYRP